jgi:hypothetical protein
VSMSFTLAEEELEAEMGWMVLGFCLVLSPFCQGRFSAGKT